MKSSIRFSDLSGWLKTAVILTWIMALFYAFAFFEGFIIGVARGL